MNVNSYGNVSSISYDMDVQENNTSNNNSNNNNNNTEQNSLYDFDYLVCVHPNQLEGMKLLWTLVQKTENNSVVELAIEFLTKLYLHLHSKFDENI